MDVKKLDFKSNNEKNITFNITLLQNNRDITIKMADKGRNVVVMNTDKYRQMCLDVLSNRDWYSLISIESIQTFNNDYDMIITGAYNNRIIDKDIFEALRVTYPRIPSFYSAQNTWLTPKLPWLTSSYDHMSYYFHRIYRILWPC